MKKSIISLVLFFALSTTLFSQIEKGTKELSLSGTFGSFSESVKSPNYSRDEESTSYIMLAFRPGFFITKSIELEPEIFLTAMENTEPSFSFSGNISYNFDIKESNITPFILAGYGIGNSISILNSLFYRASEDLDVTNLNLGAGMKIFVSSQIAVKLEYRYQRFNYDRDYQSFFNQTYITEYKINSHRLLVGFSFFF